MAETKKTKQPSTHPADNPILKRAVEDDHVRGMTLGDLVKKGVEHAREHAKSNSKFGKQFPTEKLHKLWSQRVRSMRQAAIAGRGPAALQRAVDACRADCERRGIPFSESEFRKAFGLPQRPGSD